MITRLAQFLLSRSPRECWFLTLAILILPAAVAFLVLQPMAEARTTADTRLVDAQALNQWTRARDAEMAALLAAGGAGDATPTAAIGISGVEESLVAAGLRGDVARLVNRTEGGVELAFDDVEFAIFATWLDDISGQWGYEISRLSLGGLDMPGSVRVLLQLDPEA